MYQVSDFIMYGNYGVCKVESVGTPDIMGVDESKLYYTLRSLYHNEKIYTPIDTKVFMRTVITKSEVQQLISRIPLIRERVYNNRRLRLVEDYYRELLMTHDCYDLLILIKTIRKKMKLAVEQGKKPGQINERFMRMAEDLLYGEFAVALGISKESVKGYIVEKVRKLKNTEVTTVDTGCENSCA